MSGAYAGREPVTIRDHDRPWIADLETEAHASDRALVVREAIDAVEGTRAGAFVDLVTPERHGHPSTYLYEPLRNVERAGDVSEEGRCSCGGFVTRVRIDASERSDAHDPEASHATP